MQPQDAEQLESWETVLFRAAHDMSLTEAQYELIEARYSLLQNILNVEDEPLLKGAHIFVQGSIRLHTTIKPAPDAEDEMATIDADAIVWLPSTGSATALEVLAALERRVSRGTRVHEPVQPLRRGVRIVYGDEIPGFHIDITPARNAPGNGGINGEGHLQVPDRITGWKASSPRPYSTWLAQVSAEQIEITDVASLKERHMVFAEATQDPLPDYADYIDANPLRAAIKLLKRNRDTWAIREQKTDVRPISAVITTLASRAYENVVQQSRWRSMRPIEALIALVDRMPLLVEVSDGNYCVCNPEDPGENFAEKWNRPNGEGDSYSRAFFAWHAQAAQDVRLGFRDLRRADGLETAMFERFGMPRARTQAVIEELASNVTLPGRAAGMTHNRIRMAVLAGSGVAATASAETVGRLGDTQPLGRLG